MTRVRFQWNERAIAEFKTQLTNTVATANKEINQLASSHQGASHAEITAKLREIFTKHRLTFSSDKVDDLARRIISQNPHSGS